MKELRSIDYVVAPDGRVRMYLLCDGELVLQAVFPNIDTAQRASCSPESPVHLLGRPVCTAKGGKK